MSYGYTSSEPTLTSTLAPEAITQLRDLARAAGHTQTRGAHVGDGSLSALVNALALAAYANGPRFASKRLKWVQPFAVAAKSHRTTVCFMLDETAIPALRSTARLLGFLPRRGGRMNGQGNLSGLLEAIAAAVQSEGAEKVAHRIKWIEE